jgi:hypothetical protein
MWSNVMNIKATAARLLLPRADTLTLENARGALVRCLEGALWITQHDDRADHVIAAGQAFRVDREGPVVVQATRAASLAIESPDELVLEPWWDPLRPRSAERAGAAGATP